MRYWTFVLAAVASAAGCASSRKNAPAPPTPPAGWFAAFTPEQARALTPDEAKAVAVARAAVEKDMMELSGLELKAERTTDGWSVRVTHFSFDWQLPHRFRMPGNFCVVYIDRQWNVTRVVGGA